MHSSSSHTPHPSTTSSPAAASSAPNDSSAGSDPPAAQIAPRLREQQGASFGEDQAESPAADEQQLEPTALAVADAVLQYRQAQQLSRDELAGLLARRDHPISPDRLRRIEDSEITVSVDDLVALAFALGVSPTVLLGHLPVNTPGPDQPLGTGLPEDLGYLEYQQWLRAEISLDPASRRAWYQDKRLRLRLRCDHIDDQLAAARDELEDLAVVHEEELDVARVQHLQRLVPQHEHLLAEADRALRVVEHQIEILSGRG